MVGLAVGQKYKVSWKQMNRPGFVLYSDINVKVDSIIKFAQSQVKDVTWISKSFDFTATSVSQTLIFYTTYACGGDCTVLLDTITVA
jgi:hypothetical protein